MNQGQVHVKPGIWTCIQCENVNPAMMTECLKCEASAPKEERKETRSLVEKRSQVVCTNCRRKICTLRKKESIPVITDSDSCLSKSFERSHRGQIPHGDFQKLAGWICPNCKIARFEPKCQKCSLYCSGLWECSDCGELNFLMNETCRSCRGKLVQFSKLAVGQRAYRGTEIPECSPMVNEKNTRRILIVGIVGSGKSSFANAILGKSMFKAAADFKSVTNESVCGTCTREGINCIVFDTPGFLGDELEETHKDVESIYKTFQSCFWATCPGFHAIAIVIGIGRFTPEHRQVIENIKRIFGQDCMEFVILVFTKVDTLGKRTLEDLLETADPHLKRYLRQSHNTYIGINNKAEGEANDKQIKEFLTKIEEVFARNDRKHYTNDIYEDVYRELKQEANKRGEDENSTRQRPPPKSLWERIKAWWRNLFNFT